MISKNLAMASGEDFQHELLEQGEEEIPKEDLKADLPFEPDCDITVTVAVDEETVNDDNETMKDTNAAYQEEGNSAWINAKNEDREAFGVGSDEADAAITSGEKTTVLSSNHPKLAAFQHDLNVALRRRLEAERRRLTEVAATVADRCTSRKEQSRLLLLAQGTLRAEEQRAAALTEAAAKARKNRLAAETAVKHTEKEWTELRWKLVEAIKRRNRLRDNYNCVLEKEIACEARRVSAAGEAAAADSAASATESAFRQLQEQKTAQDLYLTMVHEESERLERTETEYVEQAASLREKTRELEALVREAANEAERVRSEKNLVINRWNTTVINIAKRDQAIKSFSEALREQDLRLKEIKTQSEGTRRSIISCQEKHDYLTSVEQRMDKLCGSRKSQIKHTEELLQDASHDLSKATKSKVATLKTLDITREQVRQAEKEAEAAQRRVVALDKRRKEAEDAVFHLCQDNLTAEKNGKYTDKIIKELRTSTEDLEAKLSETRKALSIVTQQITEKESSVRDLEVSRRQLKEHTEVLHRELGETELSLLRMQAVINKRQNVIDLRLKNKAKLSKALASDTNSVNSVEANIKRVRSELDATLQYVEEAKARWIKYQREYMQKSQEKGKVTKGMVEMGHWLLVTEEKRRKQDVELRSLEKALATVGRAVEARAGVVERLSWQLHNNTTRLDKMIESLEKKSSEDANILDKLLNEIEGAKKGIDDLNKEIEEEKEKALSAEADVHDWEERLRSCKQTHSIVSRERFGEGELDALRRDINLLRSRSEVLERKTKELLDGLRAGVGRREGLVDKAKDMAVIQRSKHQELSKTEASKHLADLNNHLNKIHRDEREIQKALAEAKESNAAVGRELAKTAAFAEQVKNRSMELQTRREEQLSLKDQRLATVLRLQNRAKWYKAVQEKRYRLASSPTTAASSEGPESSHSERGGRLEDLNGLRLQNRLLKEQLVQMEQAFPHLKHSLRRIGNLML